MAGEKLEQLRQEKPAKSVIEIALERATGTLKEDSGKEPTKQDAPKVEPKADAKPAPTDDEMPDVIKKSEKASAHWKAKDAKHQADKKAWEEKYSKAEKELAELKSKPQGEVKKVDYEALEKKFQTLDDQYKKIALEKHPDFVAQFDKPLSTQLEIAKRSVTEADAEKVVKLLQLPDSEYRTEQLDMIMSELTPSKAAALGAVITKIEEISMNRAEKLKDQEGLIKEIAERNRAREEHQKSQLQSFLDKAVSEATDKEKGIAALVEKEGDEKWNGAVKERIELAKAIYNGDLPPDQRADAALWASIAPALMEQVANQIAEIEQLKSEVEKLRGGRPKIEGEEEHRRSEIIDEGKSLIDRIASMAENSGFVKSN